MIRFRSVTTSATEAAKISVASADEGGDVGRGRRQLEQRVHARDQVDARGHHRRGVDQRRDGGRALHRVGEPGVERELRRLRERADQDQQADRDDRRTRSASKRLRRRLEDARGSRSVPSSRKMRNAASTRPTSPITLITNAFMPALVAVSAPVPEADQRVGGEADERPADDQQHEVAGQHQQQHREDEEVEVAEVARVAAVGGHVGDRVEVDQRRDAADDQAMNTDSGSTRIPSLMSTPAA